MSPWEAVLLGALQGATEFLPVSSSGHLVLAQILLGISISGVVFEVAVHVATLLAVVVVYRDRLAGLVGGALELDRGAWTYIGLLVVATAPAALLGFALRPLLERSFESAWVAGVGLVITGSFLWTARAALLRGSADAPSNGEGGSPASGPHGRAPGLGAALLIGLAQACALVPGISRSGATVVAALWLGVRPVEAAAFSFLMAIPAIGGAAALQLIANGAGDAGLGGSVLLGGFVVALLVGVGAIKLFLRMLERRSFHHFAPYCVLAGGVVLVIQWLAR